MRPVNQYRNDLMKLFCLFASTHMISDGLQLCAQEQKQAEWLQWRGPERDGHVSGASWPESLNEQHLTKAWEKSLGPGYSGPIITKRYIFVTETKDRREEYVYALDRKTGKQVWQAHWAGAMDVPFFAIANGDWIRATPACDGARLYVAGMRDVLVCLDVESGAEIWRVDFVNKFKSHLPAFGFVSSPLLDDNFVYVQAGGGFAKLDKLSGKVIWHVLKDGGGMFGSAFSSPFLTRIDGQKVVLVQTRTFLAGVNPTDGKILWKQEIPAFRGMNILTPTVADNTIFTSSYGGGSLLIKAEKQDSNWKLSEIWKNKQQGYMSTPVLIAGHLYLHLRNQRFSCIDVKSGNTKWTTKPFGKYWSLVTNGETILALDEQGDLLLIRANPNKFELLDTRKVADVSWAHLAVCGNNIIVRDLHAVTVYQWE